MYNPSDYSIITFPSLGLEMNPERGFSIGSFTIHYYGVMIALGLLLAVAYGLRRRKQFGITENDLLDGVLWVTPFAIVCARAYYCIFSWSEYAADPISVLYIWNGGLAIPGGIIGAVIGILVFCKVKKIKPGTVLDLVLLGFLIGQSLGRWGNFFNREAFGAETESFLRMGLFNTKTNQFQYFHPTFLYESLWNIAGFVLLHFLSRRRKYDGQIALGYVAWYGFGRTFVEGLRVDALPAGSIRITQVLAAVCCFAAVVILLWQAFRVHDPKKLYVNQLAASQPEEMQGTDEPEEAFTEESGEDFEEEQEA
jgi:phosphatidylglycerol:prolipoprotein diacylglycerol transferase